MQQVFQLAWLGVPSPRCLVDGRSLNLAEPAQSFNARWASAPVLKTARTISPDVRSRDAACDGYAAEGSALTIWNSLAPMLRSSER